MLCYDFNTLKNKLQEKFSYRYIKNCTSNFCLQKIPMQVNIKTAFSTSFKVGGKKSEHYSKIYPRYNSISKIREQ